MNSMISDVQDVLRGVFGDDQLQLTESTTAADIDGWDSLAHLNVVIALEKRFGVKFATAEISRMKNEGENIGTLVSLINQKVR